jgi:hypothetical protein
MRGTRVPKAGPLVKTAQVLLANLGVMTGRTDESVSLAISGPRSHLTSLGGRRRHAEPFGLFPEDQMGPVLPRAGGRAAAPETVRADPRRVESC